MRALRASLWRWPLRVGVVLLLGLNLFFVRRVHEVLGRLELESIRPDVQHRADGLSTTIRVPRDTLTRRNGQTVVVAVENGRARSIVVDLAAQQGDTVIVRTGLRGDETLVSRPPEAMQDGDPVKVKK